MIILYGAQRGCEREKEKQALKLLSWFHVNEINLGLNCCLIQIKIEVYIQIFFD